MVDWITAGAIGQIGARTFMLQVSTGGAVTCLHAEKEQIAALGRFIDALLRGTGELPVDTSLSDDAPALDESVFPERRLIEIGLGLTEDESGVAFRFESIDFEAEDSEILEAECTRIQARLLAAKALADADAGRPICEKCGLPMDPEGHDCPSRNGHHPA